MTAAEQYEEFSDRMFELVQEYLDGDHFKTKRWFATRNPVFSGQTPGEFMFENPETFEGIIKKMIEDSES